MLLVLFLLSLFAAIRGWFPWSVIAFAGVYGFAVSDFTSFAYATNLQQFGISATAGSLVEYAVGGTLATMIVYERA